MADEPKASERRARTPLPRKDDDDKRKSMLSRPRMRILMIVAALLAANYVIAGLIAPGKVEPVRIPYSPTFIDQVKAGKVERISVTGATRSRRARSSGSR